MEFSVLSLDFWTKLVDGNARKFIMLITCNTVIVVLQI